MPQIAEYLSAETSVKRRDIEREEEVVVVLVGGGVEGGEGGGKAE